MTKIIGGKKYSTDTATVVGADGFGNKRNFKWWREKLYLKITGEFFLYGEGGPLSKYRHYYSANEWSGSEEIIPLSLEEAREWAKEHLKRDTYTKVFEEDNT